MVTVRRVRAAVQAAMFAFVATVSWAQAVAGPEKARPVQGDPGISSMVVLDRPEFRILRDYAEPGATRRMHAHNDAAYHVFVLVTGRLRLTIEGESPVEVNSGEALYLKGGARHTFVNIGTVTSTIVEVFGKGASAAGDAEAWAALAPALAATPVPAAGSRR
ncbi:MAG: cupin domain-containing protein [Vicinamibacterales bacterium]